MTHNPAAVSIFEQPGRNALRIAMAKATHNARR